MYFQKLFDYLDIAGPLAGVIILLYIYSSKLSGGRFIIGGYLLLQLVLNIISKFLMFAKISNIRVYQANAFFSFLIIGFWFLNELKNTDRGNLYKSLRVYYVLAVTALVLLILWEDSTVINGLSFSFAAFSICFYCIVQYSLILKQENGITPVGRRTLWTVTAIFLYYSTCFFIYIAYKYFTRSPVLNFPMLWKIHNLILFVTCIVLAFVNRKKE